MTYIKTVKHIKLKLFTLRDSADPVNTDRPIRLKHDAKSEKMNAMGANKNPKDTKSEPRGAKSEP